jgi:hypothetical protein
MEADSSGQAKKTIKNRITRTLSDVRNVLQSVWIRHNIRNGSKNNGVFFGNRYYLLFHINIFLYFILHNQEKEI